MRCPVIEVRNPTEYVSPFTLRTETTPASETLFFSGGLEYRTIDKVQKPANYRQSPSESTEPLNFRNETIAVYSKKVTEHLYNTVLAECRAFERLNNWYVELPLCCKM
jgi:hypothetical protein